MIFETTPIWQWYHSLDDPPPFFEYDAEIYDIISELEDSLNMIGETTKRSPLNGTEILFGD